MRLAGRLAIGAAMTLTLLVGAYLLVRDSSLVAVEDVEIVGARGPEADEVRRALEGAARDMTTLHVREEALERAVQTYATVRGLQVERDLPHGLRITVLRRPVIANVTTPGGRRIAVAEDGTLLPRTRPPRDVPSLKVANPPGGSRLAGDPRAATALAMIAAAPAAMRRHVARVGTGPEGLEAVLRDGPQIVIGDDTRLRAKWVAAARVLGDPGAQGARYVDVRLPERPVAGGLPETQPSTTG
jgi:cell division protein FtsQ